jgi:hypothetical protein
MGARLSSPLTLLERTMTKASSQQCQYDTTMMDHVFSGWSVWLEPERTESLDAELSYLQNSCGGPDHGVFPFVPHVTLLYNMDPSTISSLSSSSSSSQEGLSPTSMETSHHYEQLLQQCWDQLLHWQQQQQQQQQGQCNAANGPSYASFTPTKKDNEDDTRRTTTTTTTTTIDDSLILLQPTGYHYLHYPKWADGGKGFGCSIAYLLFQQQQQHQSSSTTTTAWVDQLHSICRTVLGPAERTGFIPHMSLVYAPEAYGALLQQHVATKQELEREQQQQQQQQERQQEEASIQSFLGARLQQIVGNKNNNHCTQNPSSSSSSSRDENGVWWLQPQRVAYLSLWSTEGRIQDWYPIAKIPIAASSQSSSPPPSSLT